jgi:hypothetical protein
MMYDTALDRLDVALLAVWHLVESGRWGCLEELGMTPALLQAPYEQVTQELERPRHADGRTSEKAVFRFIALAPVALEGALELIRRYQELCGWERVLFYQRLAALGSSHI